MITLDVMLGPWAQRAACHNAGTDIFYNHQRRKEAAALCNTCPVKHECLNDAIEHERGVAWNTHGYRAGMTANERTRYARSTGTIAKRPAVAECGTNSGYHRHRRLDELPCPACRHAHAAAESRRHRRRTGRAKDNHDVTWPPLATIAQNRHLYSDIGDAV